jgi:hypothetical protein
VETVIDDFRFKKAENRLNLPVYSAQHFGHSDAFIAREGKLFK